MDDFTETELAKIQFSTLVKDIFLYCPELRFFSIAVQTRRIIINRKIEISSVLFVDTIITDYKNNPVKWFPDHFENKMIIQKPFFISLFLPIFQYFYQKQFYLTYHSKKINWDTFFNLLSKTDFFIQTQAIKPSQSQSIRFEFSREALLINISEFLGQDLSSKIYAQDLEIKLKKKEYCKGALKI